MDIRSVEENRLLDGSSPVMSRKMNTTKKVGIDRKLVAFVFVGVITLIYSVGELVVAIYLSSLVLLSDGFHNLSDVISLYIAFWARQAAKRDSSDEMSYGWARTEILGGLTNGCFLLSLVLYVMLESIPKFIKPEAIESGMLFIIVSASGLVINTVGTIIFSVTGMEHAHSHGGGGGHGHSHGHGHKEEHKEKDKDKEKKKKKKKEKHELEITEQSNGHAHSHKEKKEKHGHSHGHGHDHKDKDKKKKKTAKRDENVHAVFLHYLGDAISSLLVLTAGILLHFFKGGKWTLYIDPVSSLIVCTLILYTTVPLVKRCSLILLQSTGSVPVQAVRAKLAKVEGVIGIHDLHVWQLVDGMSVASVHIAVVEGVDFNNLVSEVKKIFHEYGIHSSSIQPEFQQTSISRNLKSSFCVQNCVKECEEEWCCKKTADNIKTRNDEFSIHTEL